MESLDLGPQSATPGRRRLLILAIVVVVGLMITIGVYNSRPPSSASAPTEPAPSATTPSPTDAPLPTVSSGPEVSLPPPEVERRRTDGFLSDVDLDLFARSDTHVYRIQTKKRLITATRTPTLQSSGALIFVTGRRQVIVRDYSGSEDGFVVPDGKPARNLPAALKQADEIYPGPAGRLWVTTYQGRTSATRLTDLRGKPVRSAHGISEFKNVNAMQSNGNGGLLVPSAGGYYELTQQGAHRLTRGTVLAIGRSQLLTTDCNNALRCSTYLLNRATGKQRRLGSVPANFDGYGTLSDDGRFAALRSWSRNGTSHIRVLDLRGNTTIATVSDPNGMSDSRSMIWLPDNRLVAIQNERIVVFSPKTGRFTTPDLKISSLLQLARRPT